MTYASLMNKVIQYYENHQYDQALDLLMDQGDKVTGIDAQIDNFKFCIAAKAGKVDLALDLFETAIRQKGYWYDTDQLLHDDDISELRKRIEFQGLLEVNRRREFECRSLRKPLYIIKEGASSVGWIVFHGNHENASITQSTWQLDSLKEDTQIFVQSSLPDFHEAYHWDPIYTAIHDILPRLVEAMTHQPQVKTWFMAGFSAGCNAILQLLLDKYIEVHGAVFFDPMATRLKEPAGTNG